MCPLDHCAYIWRCKKKLIILSLNLDTLLAGNFPVMMMKIKSLASTFEKKGMGPTTNVLGIKVIMNKDAKLLYQD